MSSPPAAWRPSFTERQAGLPAAGLLAPTALVVPLPEDLAPTCLVVFDDGEWATGEFVATGRRPAGLVKGERR